MTDDITRDSNGNILADGDTVTLIKDLKVKGSGGVTLKRGTVVRKIRLTGDPEEILGQVLLSWHNIAFFQALTAAMRAAISEGRFEAFRRDFRARHLKDH